MQKTRAGPFTVGMRGNGKGGREVSINPTFLIGDKKAAHTGTGRAWMVTGQVSFSDEPSRERMIERGNVLLVSLGAEAEALTSCNP